MAFRKSPRCWSSSAPRQLANAFLWQKVQTHPQRRLLHLGVASSWYACAIRMGSNANVSFASCFLVRKRVDSQYKQGNNSPNNTCQHFFKVASRKKCTSPAGHSLSFSEFLSHFKHINTTQHTKKHQVTKAKAKYCKYFTVMHSKTKLPGNPRNPRITWRTYRPKIKIRLLSAI